MEEYGALTVFVYWVCLIILALIFFGFLSMLIGEVRKLYPATVVDFPVKSEESDDFMVESERILEAVRARQKAYGFIKDARMEEYECLEDSSQVASFVRYAHYAGYHVTFEQMPEPGAVDPEEGNPDVFKTDMAKAAASLEQRRWTRYRRY